MIRTGDRVTHPNVFNVGTVVSVDGTRAHVHWDGVAGVWVEPVDVLTTCEDCRGTGFLPVPLSDARRVCSCAFAPDMGMLY